MNIDKLVRMANQIERFFRSEPDRDAAVAGIADHIRRFWEPRMREAIVAHLDAGGEGLDELARRAIERYRDARGAEPGLQSRETSHG
ncbi:MAG: formate dehydrogenase subunit delta [Burkholderiaceae bacterium]|nr:formate dehydrogenase subunit delta [Burkholderiaceae bacterium]